MTLSRRERLIVVTALVAVSLLLLDRFSLTPFLEHRAEIKVRLQALSGEMQEVEMLFKRRKLLEKKWNEMLRGGLTEGASKTQSRILHGVRTWAQQEGLTLTSVKPGIIPSEENLGEMQFLIVGTGSMRSVGQFLWNVETTLLPLKVTEMQIGSRTEEGNELSLQLRLSALYLVSENESTKKGTRDEK